MDLFPNQDDPLVKYCLTLENEQKILLSEIQKLDKNLEIIQNKLSHRQKVEENRFLFLLKNCKVSYQVGYYFQLFSKYETIKPVIDEIEKEIYQNLNLTLDKTRETQNQLSGRHQSLNNYGEVGDLYDTLNYHRFAVKIIVVQSKSQYFSEYNRDNPQFNPNLHFLQLGISVNPSVLYSNSEVVDILPSIAMNLSTHGDRFPTNMITTRHMGLEFNLSFDGTIEKKVLPGSRCD